MYDAGVGFGTSRRRIRWRGKMMAVNQEQQERGGIRGCGVWRKGVVLSEEVTLVIQKVVVDAETRLAVEYDTRCLGINSYSDNL